MAEFVSVNASPRATPVVTLAQLPDLARQLAIRVRAGGFEPELIVYIEAGARLFAHATATILRTPLAPMWVRRSGRGLKAVLAPLAVRLPVPVRDWLRRTEERSGVHRVTRRWVSGPDNLALAGKRVLLLDDAADTGRTIAVARERLVALGAAPENLRTAVLAATTPVAQGAVDFFVLTRNCRMPWSADSDERHEAGRRAAALAPAHAPRDF